MIIPVEVIIAEIINGAVVGASLYKTVKEISSNNNKLDPSYKDGGVQKRNKED